MLQQKTVNEEIDSFAKSNEELAAAKHAAGKLKEEQAALLDSMKGAEDDATATATRENQQVEAKAADMMRKFEAENDKMADVGRYTEGKFMDLENKIAGETDLVTTLLMNMKDVYGTAKDSIRQRQDGVLALHKKNEDALKLLSGMA